MIISISAIITIIIAIIIIIFNIVIRLVLYAVVITSVASAGTQQMLGTRRTQTSRSRACQKELGLLSVAVWKSHLCCSWMTRGHAGHVRVVGQTDYGLGRSLRECSGAYSNLVSGLLT